MHSSVRQPSVYKDSQSNGKETQNQKSVKVKSPPGDVVSAAEPLDRSSSETFEGSANVQGSSAFVNSPKQAYLLDQPHT